MRALIISSKQSGDLPPDIFGVFVAALDGPIQLGEKLIKGARYGRAQGKRNVPQRELAHGEPALEVNHLFVQDKKVLEDCLGDHGFGSAVIGIASSPRDAESGSRSPTDEVAQ